MNYKEYTVKVFDNGNKYWYLNGKCHREDGPAIEYANGSKLWYLNDQLHREDGPAVEYANGDKRWFLDGKEYTEADFNKEIAKRRQPTPTCEGKVVEIDGKKYKLTSV